MPTLSNEEVKQLQQILYKLFGESECMDDPDHNVEISVAALTKAEEQILALIATQNTALLKEVATQVIGEDEPEYTIVQDSPEKPKLYDVTAVRKNQLRAEMRSKLAAMGEQ